MILTDAIGAVDVVPNQKSDELKWLQTAIIPCQLLLVNIIRVDISLHR